MLFFLAINYRKLIYSPSVGFSLCQMINYTSALSNPDIEPNFGQIRGVYSLYDCSASSIRPLSTKKDEKETSPVMSFFSGAYKPSNFLRHFKSVWIGLDCFNLFDISNVSSYYWVTDVNEIQYAVPNYLTRRQINVRLSVNF